MGRVTKRVGRLGARIVQDGVNATQTVTARLPGLMSPNPSFADLQERNRMVAEKMDAFTQGAMAAGMAWGAFWMKAAFGGVRGPGDLMAEMLDITDAAMQPASVKVRANARRLSRGH